MSGASASQGLSVNVVYGVLVANVPTPLTREGRAALRTAVLDGLAGSRARALVLDLSAVGVLDDEDAAHLLGTARAARLLGARTAVAGLGPGIAAAWAELGVSLGEIAAHASLDAALTALRAGPR
jgi:rsbT co-antagonist protein RsbR